MLTYEEDDNKWDNWDGGYWGREIYPEKKKNNCMKFCCITCICCPILMILVSALLFMATNGKIFCSIPYIQHNFLCSDNNSSSTSVINNTSYNNSNISYISNYTSNNQTNNSFYTNTSIFTPNDPYERNIENNVVYRNDTQYINSNIANISNVSYSASLFKSNINNDIENNPKKQIHTGEAIGISIGAVLGFILFIAGSVYVARKGTYNIKSYCTNKTVSRHNEVQLTEEELKFYEVRNPLQEAFDKNQGGLFQRGVHTLKKAIQKDREREFDEAIKLYNNGIDLILNCLKTSDNASDRFAIAKKIDIYVKRVNYITNCRENQKLIQDIKNSK